MSIDESRVQSVFFAALDRESQIDRVNFLDSACGADVDLRQRVERLLAAQPQVGDFLNAKSDANAATLIPSATTEDVGSVIGVYKLREILGEGGMGIVYAATQERPMRRKVALKVIKPGMDSKEVIGRFEAERQALALMDHPNIARVHEAGTTESGRPYFVMELVRGMPITDYCDRASVTLRERLKLFITVCQAVQHAHQKGIIHRDLKPSNVLITLHDGVPVPKVIDFGVAKAINQKLTERTIYTRVSQMVGTPLYMSPEQAELSGLDVDTRSDVYSLGVLLYELLTGITPFDKDTLSNAGFDEMRRIIREDEPPRPSQRVSTLEANARSTASGKRGLEERHFVKILAGELDWIVMKALEKDRQRRYESPSAFAADIQRYLDDERVEACPPSAAYRLRKLVRRHRGVLITSVIVMAALVVGTGVSIWYALAADRSYQIAERRGRDLENKNRAIAVSEAKASQNYALAKQAVADLVAKIAQEKLGGFPQLAELRTGLLTKASDFYSALIETNPEDYDLYVQRAEMSRWRMDDQAALKDYEIALKLAPDNGDLHATVGGFYANSLDNRVKNIPLAIQHLQRGVALNPKHADAWYRLAHLGIDTTNSLKKSFELEQRPAWKQLLLAELLQLGENDLPGALEAYGNAIVLATDLETKTTSYYRRAWFLDKQGRRQEAIEDLTRALEGDAFNYWVFGFRGRVYEKLGQVDFAMRDWERATELSGRTWWYRNRLAKRYFEKGLYEKALTHLALIAEYNPREVDNLSTIDPAALAACTDEGFRENYLAWFQQVLAAVKPSAESRLQHAALSVLLGQPNEASNDLVEIMADVNAAPDVWYQAALLSLRSDNPLQFREFARLLSSRDPSSLKVSERHWIAWIAVVAPNSLDNYDAAITSARHVLALDPADCTALLDLGGILYRAGKFDEALEILTRSESAPANAITLSVYTRYFLAMTQHNLGNHDEARLLLERSIAETDRMRAERKSDGGEPLTWFRQLTLELLRAEATALIREAPAETIPPN